MKNKISISITILFLAFFMSASAQDATTSKGFIGISGGYSMPFGNIVKTEYLNPKAGFAKGGAVFSLDAAHFFNKHVGIGVFVSKGTYGINNKDSIFSSGYVEAFAVDEVTLTVGHYSTLNILPVLYFTLPMNKLNIDFRLMAGLTGLTTPEVTVQLEDNTDSKLTQQATTGGGFGYGIGAGLRYKFSKHLGLALNADLLSGKPKVTIANTNFNNPTDLLRVVNEYNETISSFNGLIGLAYNF